MVSSLVVAWQRWREAALAVIHGPRESVLQRPVRGGEVDGVK
jgi:hypothetical protein